MIGDIPIVTKVRPAGSRTLHVRFAGDDRFHGNFLSSTAEAWMMIWDCVGLYSED